MEKIEFNLKYVFLLTGIAAMGGFLFGYDWVVIGGAKPFYELFFGINNSPAMQGWAMSSALVGCIFGAVLAGFLSEKFGRRSPLILAASFFIISAFGTGYTNNFSLFIIYRLVGGFGIGLTSTISPMYIAEISPKKYRGRLVSVNQLTIVIGILSAQVLNYIIAEPIPADYSSREILNSWNGQWGWRWMFWMELFPAALFLILLFVIPESPRYLIIKNRRAEMIGILKKIGGIAYANHQADIVEQTVSNSKNDTVVLSELVNKRFFPVLLIGIVLAVLQQWSGINIIFNYADEIFTSAGYSVSEMLFQIVITGSVNLIFTIVAMRTVDKWGRRYLMLLGTIGLSMIYGIMGMAYYFEVTGWPIVLLIVLAISIYAMTLAPIVWVVLSEIFPNRLRGMAMSMATFSLWTSSFVLTFTFPILNDFLGSYGTFWTYGIICFLGYLFIKKRLPETKGKSLEEIETELIDER